MRSDFQLYTILICLRFTTALVVCICTFGLETNPVSAHRTDTHAKLIKEAAKATETIDPALWPEIKDYISELGRGAIEADEDWGSLGPNDHALNPVTGKGWLGQQRADQGARVWWDKAKSFFKQGDLSEAYRYLGLATHNAQDMFSPAHSHAIVHAPFPGADPDDFDGYIEPHMVGRPTYMPRTFDTPEALVVSAANLGYKANRWRFIGAVPDYDWTKPENGFFYNEVLEHPNPDNPNSPEPIILHENQLLFTYIVPDVPLTTYYLPGFGSYSPLLFEKNNWHTCAEDDGYYYIRTTGGDGMLDPTGKTVVDLNEPMKNYLLPLAQLYTAAALNTFFYDTHRFLSGKVRDSHGIPISGANVVLSHTSGVGLFESVTDENGKFKIPDEQPAPTRTGVDTYDMFIPIGEYSMVVYGSDSKGCILEIYDFEIERGWIPDGRPYTVVIDGIETCDEPDPEDCSNGVDDDGDSYTDCDDSDCYGSEGCDIDNSDPTFIQLPRGGTAKLGDFTGYYLSPSSSPDKSDTLDLEYNVAVPSQVSILIYDSGGSLARTLVDRAIRGAGSNIDNWDGRDDAGEYVPDGVYKFVVSAVNAQKSSEVWDWSGEIVVDNTPPTAAISFIKANDQQFHYYSIIGTASDEQLSAYTLECLDENTYRFLGSEQSPVENGILSWINSAHLDNTSCILKLTVTDRAGNIATDEMPMVIDRTSNGLKIHVNSVVQRMQLATEGYVPAADDINVWIEDGLPPGSTAIETWEWNGNIVYSGMVSHTDPVQEGTHGHYFIHADATIVLGYNENIIQYVYLDPADPPQQILMQFYTDDGNGEYRAYWGSDNIKTGGRSGSASLYRMGELPATGRWIRLKIPAITIDLSGKEVKGIAFVAYDGKAYWDKTTKSSNYNEAQKGSWILASQIGTDDRTDAVISYSTSQDADIKLSIYDEENKLVKTLIDEFKAEGSHQIVWDGTDSIGNQAPDGKYYFQFSSYDGPIDSNAFFLMPGDWSSEVVEARTSASDSDENTYEVDFSNQAVHKYDQTATLLFSTTGQNVGLDAFEPTAIVLDINDNLFIIDRNLARIFKLNRHGYSLNELPYPADNSWADRTIGFDEPDAVSLDRNGDLLVANQNGNEILKLAVGRGVIEISNITAEIRVPYEDSLLSATIPIIGTASARGFDRYTVEIGAGESPTVWSTLVTAHAEVFDDRKPLPPSRTLYGNLASWHTSRVPMGTYTIRLTVYNRTGSFKQDRVTVEVADLVGRRGSTVISNDGVVTFEIPSGGIADDYDLFSIKALEIGEAPPVSDPDLILLGNIYEFRPPGYQFLKDCTLKMYYTDEQLGDVDENTLKIYRWNPLIQRWIFVFADLDTADNVLTTTLSALNDYKVYYAIIADPPPAPVIFQPASPTNLKSISVYGRATPSVSVEVLVDGESQGITRADENTGNFVLHGVQLSEGDNIFTAKAFDPVGNTSPQSAPVLVQVVLTQPTDVTSVAFKTSDFLADLSGDVAVGDFLYIELIGIDADAASIDSATVTVASSVTDPGGISVQLLETAVDSGIYRGTARIGETTDGLAGTIGVSVAISETISAVSDVDPIKQDTVNTADAIPPPAPTITSPTHPSLCQNTFEADSGEWANMSNQYGASVERSAIAASTGSYSIKLVNTEPGGDFANYIRTTPYDARHYPIVSFDYKIPEGVKVNMVAFVNGMWKEIVFTDDPKTVETFDEDLYRTIGYIEGVVRDNSWHHVGFNLYNMLKNDDPEQTEYIVEELFFSDYNLPGWMELIMGEENAGGAAYYIDNFIITEGGKSSDNPTFIWQPNDASVVAYSYVLDQNPETVPDQLSEGASNSATYSNIGDGVWYFHVRSLDGGGNWGPANHYQIVIDANGPVADSPVPEDGSSSGSLEVRCRITDVGGSGVNPDSIRFDLDGTVHDMASGGLAFDEETGILTFSLWKVFPVPDPWLDGETIQASLIAVEDFAGNPLQEIISWSWIVDYSQLAGGYLSLLTTQGGFTPTWCPNGTRIAFMSERSGNQDIWVIDADDYAELAGTAQQLTFDEANDHHPAWSPVDDRIAFVSDRDGYGHIWVINADRTGLMQLTTGDYDDSHPTWSPDGQTIAFSRGGEIWKMDADGSNEAQVTYESVEWNLEPVWSPDGSKVAFTKSLYMDQVAVMDADGVNKKALTQSGRDILPTWSKQTDQVIFVTRRDEKTNSVWIMNSNGSNEDVYIDNEGMWWDSEPAQSPVNEEVAFQSTRNGVWNIWVKTTLQVADFAASPDPFSPNEDGIKDTVDIKFNLLKGAAKIDLKIYDAANSLILTLLDQQLGVAGENIVVWNGTDDNGNTVADGTYTFRIFVTGSAGSASIEKSGTISVDTTAPQFSDWTVPEIYGAVSEDVDIAVKVSDNSALNTSATKLQYAIASSADMTNPDTLGWTDFGSGSNGTLNLRWSNYAGFYLYIRAFAEDDLGNVNYSDVQKQLISLAISRRTTIQLKEGFNLISIPAEIAFAPELQEWLAFIGGVDQVDKVMVYDADGGRFITIEPGQDTNPSFVMRGGEGLIVYAKQNSDITFNNVLCSNPNYKRGFNFAGIACPAFGYSAFEFLTDLANENISSIQRYSTEKGYFETAGFDSNGQPVGIDFPIVPGEGYFVYAGERQPCFDNTVCESAEFCEKPLGECAGGGFCTPRPQNCPALWDPVCGCDDIVYGNACEAAATGVSLAHKGSCKAGGPCEYNDITGMATIVSVFEPGASENNCPNNPKKVIFNFVPDDPLAADNYLHPGWPDENIVLMIGAGMNPSNDWIMEEGLTEGTQHVCLRREITAGSCTPVIFEFTNVDYDRANELCSP